MPESYISTIDPFTEVVPQGSDLERGDSSTGNMAESQVGTPKAGGVSPLVNKKFPFLIALLLIILLVVTTISIYLLIQARTMTLEKISPSPTPSPIISTSPAPSDLSDLPGYCIPTYTVEINTVELTAKQNYSLECTSKKTEESCLLIDIYNQKTDDKGSILIRERLVSNLKRPFR